jgi:hypothetical protein
MTFLLSPIRPKTISRLLSHFLPLSSIDSTHIFRLHPRLSSCYITSLPPSLSNPKSYTMAFPFPHTARAPLTVEEQQTLVTLDRLSAKTADFGTLVLSLSLVVLPSANNHKALRC